MVDNVLSDESGHRRFLFEEAAGIMRYKTRKKEALQKLDLTVTDLTRVNDIVTEIEREVRSLARQVGKARRYNRLREEIKSLDLGLAKEDYDRLAGAGGALHAEHARAEERRVALTAILARHEADLEQLKLQLLERETEVRKAQDELNEREARGASLLNEVAVLRERRAGLSEKLDHARSEGIRLEGALEELQRAKERLAEERNRLGSAQEAKSRELQEMDAALAEVQPRLEERRAGAPRPEAALARPLPDPREAAGRGGDLGRQAAGADQEEGAAGGGVRRDGSGGAFLRRVARGHHPPGPGRVGGGRAGAWPRGERDARDRGDRGADPTPR